MKSLLQAAAIVTTVVGFIGFTVMPASAVTCSAAVAAKVSGTSGCELGGDDNDNKGGGVLDVNTHSVFGGNWIFQGKDNGLNGVDESPSGTTNPLGLVLSGGVQSGIWSIAANAFDLFEDIMLVFKGPDANSGTQPDTYVAYLLSATSGSYMTPFAKTNPQGQVNAQGTSHVSIYARGEPTQVIPLPASLPLFLAGLGGLGFIGWRRRGA